MPTEKENHLYILTQIREDNGQDEHFVHRVMMHMMDNEGFEPSREIIAEILKERPDLAKEIKIFKDIIKEIRNIIRDFEKFNEMTP
jgi:hypothetical protein